MNIELLTIIIIPISELPISSFQFEAEVSKIIAEGMSDPFPSRRYEPFVNYQRHAFHLFWVSEFFESTYG